MMIPIITRTTEELLNLVPSSLREGALALGATRARAAFSVMVPAALPGIMTGSSWPWRASAGETAPLLFTAFNNRFFSTRLDQPIASLTVQVYTYAISPYDDWHRQAWAGALVLVAVDLRVLGSGARRDQAARKDASDDDGYGDDRFRVEPPAIRAAVPGRPAVEPKAPPPTATTRTRMETRKLRFFYGRKPGALRDLARDPREVRDGVHRPVRLRQVDVPALPEPDERHHPGHARRGRRPPRRQGHLRARHRRRGPAPAGRDGLPEVEPLPQVDLRQRRVRPADQRARAAARSCRSASRRRCAAPRSGTRSRTGSTPPRSGSRAASSSGSASRARSPSSRRSS